MSSHITGAHICEYDDEAELNEIQYILIEYTISNTAIHQQSFIWYGRCLLSTLISSYDYWIFAGSDRDTWCLDFHLFEAVEGMGSYE